MPQEKLYDLSFLMKLSNGDKEFIQEMVSTFLEMMPEYLANSEKYLDKGNMDALSQETHKFIPGVSFLGVKSMEADLMKLEDLTKKKENLEEVPVLFGNVKASLELLGAQFKQDFKIS